MNVIVLKSAAPKQGSRIDRRRQSRPPLRYFIPQTVRTLLVGAALLFGCGRSASAVPQDSLIGSYILKETGSPTVLMAKDIDHPVAPASLTKVLTCTMAIESGRLDDEVVITREATLVEPTKAGFRVGDRIRLRDLVKAAMVNSSNDAAFAIGIHLGGSVSGFVPMMNARARALGMTSSHFTNPAGFDAGVWAGNRTTARDLMTLTEHAVRNPEFNAIARLDHVTFRDMSGTRVFSLKTHNKMLEVYPYSVGIKTGFTNRAGKCLIARAIKDRKDLLMVMLNARTDRWAVASNMFDHGFGSATGDRMPMPVVARRDSAADDRAAASRAVAERERSLALLRQKVARQTEAGMGSGGVKPEGHAAGVVSKRQVAVAAAAAPVVARKALAARKSSLKASRKAALVADRGGRGHARQVLKGRNVAHATASGKAVKAGKRSRPEGRAALVQKRKTREVMKNPKTKHRKVALVQPRGLCGFVNA